MSVKNHCQQGGSRVSGGVTGPEESPRLRLANGGGCGLSLCKDELPRSVPQENTDLPQAQGDEEEGKV